MPIRPSPNELNRLVREETEKRKRMRLMQVREQARVNAARLRNAYKSEMNRQVDGLARKYRMEALDDKENQIKALVEQYEESLRHVGDGHHTAKEWRDPHWDRLIAEEAAAAISKERYQIALDQLRETQTEEELAATESSRLRKNALDIERSRAKYVASLPKPPEAPYEEALQGKKGHAVAVCDRNAMSATHYHVVPRNYAVEPVDPDSEAAIGLDARAKAIKEEERLSALRQRTVTGLEENVVKAEMRGRDAIRRELVRQDYESMMRDLEGLSRGDLARRQRDFQRLPQRLFAVPHRAGHEARLDERMRERGFESAFAGVLSGTWEPERRSDDEDEDDSGQPRPAIKPSHPTRVKRSGDKRQAGNDGDGNPQGGSRSNGHTDSGLPLPDGDTTRLSKADSPQQLQTRQNVPPRNSSNFARQHEQKKAPKPQSKEQKLQKLYDKIRSQRDQWLGIGEPVRDHNASNRLQPRSTVDLDEEDRPESPIVHHLDHPAPFDLAMRSLTPPSTETSQMDDSLSTPTGLKQRRTSDERDRAPGRRPPMTNLDGLGRIRSSVLTQSQHRRRPESGSVSSRTEVVEEDVSTRSVSERDRLDDEMKELDRKMDELKRRGRAMMAGSRYPEIGKRDPILDIQPPCYQRYSPESELSKKSHIDSTSVTSQPSWDSHSKSFSQETGDRYATTPFSPPERDAPVETSKISTSSIHVDAVRDYQRRALDRLESVSSYGSSAQRSDLQQTAAHSRQAMEDLERQVQRLRDQLDRENRREELLRHYINVKAARGQLENIGDSYCTDKITSVTSVSDTGRYSEFDMPSQSPPVHLRSSVPTTDVSVSRPPPDSTPFFSDLSHSCAPPCDDNELLFSSAKATRSTRDFSTDLDRSSFGVRALPSDVELASGDVADHLNMQEMLEMALAGSIGQEFMSFGFGRSQGLTGTDDGANNIVIEPGELTFDTLPTSDASQMEEEQKNSHVSPDAGIDFNGSDTTLTPVASPDTAVLAAPRPISPLHLETDDSGDTVVPSLDALPFRFREKPPPVRHPLVAGDLELSRITEVDTPLSSSLSCKTSQHAEEPTVTLTLDQEEVTSQTTASDAQRAALLRDFFAQRADALLELKKRDREEDEEDGGSMRSSLTQHTAALSDLCSSGVEEEFCSLPALVREEEEENDLQDGGRLTLESLTTEVNPDSLSQHPNTERESDSAPLEANGSRLTLESLSLIPETEGRSESLSQHPNTERETSSAGVDSRLTRENLGLILESEGRSGSLSQHPNTERESDGTPLDQEEPSSAFVGSRLTLKSLGKAESLSQHPNTEQESDDTPLGRQEEEEGRLSRLTLESLGKDSLSQHPNTKSVSEPPTDAGTEERFDLAAELMQQRRSSTQSTLVPESSHDHGLSEKSASLSHISASTSSLPQFRDDTSAKTEALSQHTATASDTDLCPRADANLTQLPVSDTASSKRAEITQNTVSTLKSVPAHSLSQVPTSCFSSESNLRSERASVKSLTQVEVSAGPVVCGSGEEALSQVEASSTRGSEGDEQRQVMSRGASVETERATLSQYPATNASSKGSRQLTQFEDVEEIVSEELNGVDNAADEHDTLQALDMSMPSEEVVSKMTLSFEKKTSDMPQLPVAGDQQTTNTSESFSSIDRLIAESRKIRQLNEHSLRSFELTSTSGILGEPDLSLVSGTNESDLSQYRVKLLSDEDKESEGPHQATESSLSSFQRHELSCNSDASPRSQNSSDNQVPEMSLQEAFEAYRSHKFPIKEPSKESTASKSQSSSDSKPPERSVQPDQPKRPTSLDFNNKSRTRGDLPAPNAGQKTGGVKSQTSLERRLVEARQKEAARRELPPEPPQAGSIEEMKSTLDAWKKARLTRNRASKSNSQSSSASTSSGRSTDDLRSAPTRRGNNDEDPVARNKRLWNQLEEVKSRAQAEKFQKERVNYRVKGREYSDKLRAQLRSKATGSQANATGLASRSNGTSQTHDRPKA